MQMVFAEATLLVHLYDQGLVQRLFNTSHSFHVVDIVADGLDKHTKSLFLASGMVEQPLESGKMLLVAEACRTLSCACVGEAASLVYAEATGSELLTASIPFSKLERARRCGVHDYGWIEAALAQGIAPRGR